MKDKIPGFMLLASFLSSCDHSLERALVQAGDNCELMCWRDVWKALGVQTASSNELIFDSMPSGGLYVLRNRTKGTRSASSPMRMENRCGGEESGASPR